MPLKKKNQSSFLILTPRRDAPRLKSFFFYQIKFKILEEPFYT